MSKLVFLCVICGLMSVCSAQFKLKEICARSYTTNILTINKNSEPYWFQKKYDSCVIGTNIREINASTLHVEGNNVKGVIDFPTATKIFMDNIGLRSMPFFVDLPSLISLSLSGNKISTVNSGYFQQVPLKTLIFSSNQITRIEDNAIPETVEELFVTCNNLTVLSPKWFKNPAGLKQLNLGGNKLTAIPNDMFKDFLNLDHLELRNNEIITLGSGSISGPKKMSYLHLGYNNISEIKGDVFGPVITVNYVDIQYNRLSFLHQDLMDKLKVKNLKIWGNPWQCPCQDIVHAWMTKNSEFFSVGLTREEDPSCVYALSFKNRCVPYVDDELYQTFLMNFETYPIQFC